MNVLLLGDFSGFHKFLKEGLLELGNIKVLLASNGDGWKKIDGNNQILYSTLTAYKSKYSIRRAYDSLWKPYSIAKEFKRFDVVQLISPLIYRSLINENILCKIIKNNNVVSLVEAGSGYKVLEAYNHKMFDYFIYDYDPAASLPYDSKTIRGKLNIHCAQRIEELCDLIIPCMYEYMIGYQTTKRYSTIPLPINVKGIDYKENKIHGKMVFFHGINRELSKGTPFISAALKKLKDKYPKDVEIIIKGRMPYNDYIRVMEKANVILDQCCGYSYGINACIAMAQGKVVLAGNRPETREALGVSYCPIFHIEPDVEQIYQQLVQILEYKREISQMGYESRKYVEEVHDNIIIAQKYVDAWKSTGKL